MTGDVRRLIDPALYADAFVAKRLGYQPQADFAQTLEQQVRAADAELKTVTFFPQQIGPFYREAVGSLGNAAYTTRQGIPTSATAWGTVLSLGFPMPREGEVLGGYLWSGSVWTAGTAMLRVRITVNGAITDYDLTDCVINGALDASGNFTRTQMACASALPGSGIEFPAGAIIKPYIVTAASFAPASDMGCQIVAATAGDT